MNYNNVNVNVSGPVQPTSTYKTKVLKGNHSFASQVTEPNMKYVIKHNFDLGGGSVTIPEGCLIEFDGGKLSNGTLVGNDTFLIYNQQLYDVINNVDLEGTFIHKHNITVDDEDIEEVNNVIHLKNRKPASETNPNGGMGRIILRKNKSFAEQLTQENTIYEIRYDFNLDGAEITIPANCVLEFDGGSLSNGNINLNGTDIIAPSKKIFESITLTANRGLKLKTSWFGINDITGCSDLFKGAINACMNQGTLYVDTNVLLEKPILINYAVGTTIIGIPDIDTPKSSLDRNSGRIKSTYNPSVDNEARITIKSEQLTLQSLTFYYTPSSTEHNGIMIDLVPQSESGADLDAKITNCYLGTTPNICNVRARGRGFYFCENTTVCNGWPKFETPIVQLIGKATDSESKFDGRGIYLNNNRIHRAVVKYFVEFLDDPDSDKWIFLNVQICNNHSDYGTYVVKSSAKHNGLLICNNAFNFYGKDLAGTYLYDFSNSVSNLIISNNSYLHGRKGEHDNESPRCDIVFNLGQNVEIKNVLIVNNAYENCRLNSVAKFLNDTNESVPTVKNITVSGNILSNFIPYSGSNTAWVWTNGVSLENFVVESNVADEENLTTTLKALMCWAQSYAVYSLKHGKLLFNSGNNELQQKQDAASIIDVVNSNDFAMQKSGTTAQRPVVSSTYRRFSLYIGFQYFDTTLGKPIYIKNISGDTVTWVDATGATV